MPSQPMKVRPWRCTHQGDARLERPAANCSTKPLTTVAAMTIDMIMKKRRSLPIGASLTVSANVAMSLAPKRRSLRQIIKRTRRWPEHAFASGRAQFLDHAAQRGVDRIGIAAEHFRLGFERARDDAGALGGFAQIDHVIADGGE